MENNYTCRADKPANEWLLENGLCAKQLIKIELALLQAKKIAHNLLKHNAMLLEQNQAATLNTFLRAMSHGNTRRRLNTRHAHKIMNIGTAVNRKLFKQHKQLKA